MLEERQARFERDEKKLQQVNPDLNRSRDKKLDQVLPQVSRSNSLIQKKQDESSQLLLEPPPDRMLKL